MGLIARAIEEIGIPTVCIILRREVSLNVKTPRSLFIKFPFGAPLGPANDAATQRAVIEEALQMLVTATEPVTILDSERAWKK